METRIHFEKISDLFEAKKIWELLSPKLVIYDDWDFRFTLYKYFQHPLHFYVGFVEDEAIGLLPLQWNEEQKHLEFFGEYNEWMDQNKVFIKSGFEEYIPQFYDQVSEPLKATSIVGEDAFTSALEFDNDTFFLPVQGMQTHEDYFQKYLSGQRRKMFRRIIKHTEELGVEIRRNQLEDIETMFDLNLEHFGDDSSFVWPYRKEIFRDFANLGLPLHLLSFVIHGKVEAVSFCLGYKNTFVSLNSGVNRRDYEELNSYITFKELDEACAVGADIYDIRGGDYNWKSSWHFEKIPQYKLLREICS
jgi:hypothetical protein